MISKNPHRLTRSHSKRATLLVPPSAYKSNTPIPRALKLLRIHFGHTTRPEHTDARAHVRPIAKNVPLLLEAWSTPVNQG